MFSFRHATTVDTCTAMEEAEHNVEQVRSWIKESHAHAPATVAQDLEQQIQQQRDIIADIEQRQQLLRDVSEQQKRHNFAVANDDVGDMLESLEQFRLDAGARLEEMLQAQRIKRSYDKEVEDLDSKITDAQNQMQTTAPGGSPEELRRRLAQHNVRTTRSSNY